jgi:hypothetical protein
MSQTLGTAKAKRRASRQPPTGARQRPPDDKDEIDSFLYHWQRCLGGSSSSKIFSHTVGSQQLQLLQK